MCTEHLRSLIRIYTGRILDNQGAKYLNEDNEDSDQTSRMSKGTFFDVVAREYRQNYAHRKK